MTGEPMRPGLIIEGLCPYGHGPLERREDDGWCVPCGFGYFVHGDSFGFTMEHRGWAGPVMVAPLVDEGDDR